VSDENLNLYNTPRRNQGEESGSNLSSLPTYKYFAVPSSPMPPPPNPLWLFQESCAFKATTGVVLGGGVGIMMGLFFGILGADPAVPIGPGGRVIPAAPVLTQARIAWRALGRKQSGIANPSQSSQPSSPDAIAFLRRREGNTMLSTGVSLAAQLVQFSLPSRGPRRLELAV